MEYPSAKVGNETEHDKYPGFSLEGVYSRAPNLLLLPTLGPKVYKHHLHYAIWNPRIIGDRICFQRRSYG